MFTERFYAENLTIRNTSGNVGQAEALYTAADAHLFKNCILEGFQDTYKANTGARGYFTGCKISGSTDFIYDGGLEWFEGCDIICLYNPNGGYITAPAEAGLTLNRTFYPELSAQAFRAGLFFNSCKHYGRRRHRSLNLLPRPSLEGEFRKHVPELPPRQSHKG